MTTSKIVAIGSNKMVSRHRTRTPKDLPPPYRALLRLRHRQQNQKGLPWQKLEDDKPVTALIIFSMTPENDVFWDRVGDSRCELPPIPKESIRELPPSTRLLLKLEEYDDES